MSAHVEALRAYIKAIVDYVDFIGRLSAFGKFTTDDPDSYAGFGMCNKAIENTRQAAVVAGVHAGEPRSSMQQLHVQVMEFVDMYRKREFEGKASALVEAHSVTVERIAPLVRTLNDLLAILQSRELGTEEAPSSAQKPPTQKQNEILLAMFELKATDPSRRKKTSEIIKRAFGEEANPDSSKRDISDLQKRKLIDTKSSSDGGCWLTDTGISYVKNLPKNR